ncbi:hypothetical protein [Streptomyces sp. NPDC007369]|uniref:hypothetical protein n=1 Tax=Streptomyces sp. NPDC007369 TaxID=3154589 RepID=UPI0033CA9278
MALKANSPDEDPARDKAAEIAQEDEHLLRLTAVGAVRPDYRIGAGPWDGGRWLAVCWVGGVPLWRALALARGPEGDRPWVGPWLQQIARTWAEHLAGMHAAGWAHADIQPTNTLVTPGGRAGASWCGPVAAGSAAVDEGLAATCIRGPPRQAVRFVKPPTIAP